MGKRLVIASAILFLFTFAGFAMASTGASASNYSLQTEYAPNSPIVGYISINLNNIPMNSTVVTPYGNRTLSSLIAQQNNFEKTCVPKGCLPSYSVVPGTSDVSKVVVLGKGQNYTIGLVIPSTVGKIASISSGFSVNVSSNATAGASQKLFLDLLGDGSKEWEPYQSSGTFSIKHSGCFWSFAPSISDAILTSSKYCEIVNLTKAPSVKIGASIFPTSSSGSATIKFWIKRDGQSYYGTCTNTTGSITPEGELSCIPDISGGTTTGKYKIDTSGSYYVCISEPSDTDTSYSIKEETDPSICGFVGDPPKTPAIDFPLFAEQGEFSPIGKIILNDSIVKASIGYSVNLESYINNSLLATQYGMDCSNGCIIPLKLVSNATQKINVSGFVIKSYYQTIQDGQSIPKTLSPGEGKVADVKSVQATVSAEKQNLSLTVANIVVPQNFGDQNFYVKIYNGTKMIPILSKKITIEKIPQVTSINPETTSAEISTPFTVKVETFGANANITQYKWDFGDGSQVVTTTTNKATHTYGNISLFNVSVSIKNSLGQSSSKNFTVNVTSPKDAARKLLSEYSTNGANIQNYLDTLPGFTKSALENILDWNNTQFIINYALGKNTTANTDADYLDIMKKLVTINVPNSIQQTSVANSLVFVPDSKNIDFEALKQITNSNYDSSKEADYTSALITWIFDNTHITADYSEYSSVKSSSQSDPILDVVSLDVNVNSSSSKTYLVLPNLENFNSSTNYSTEGNYIYFTIPPGSDEKITFSTTQSLNPVGLPMIISPSLSKLQLNQNDTSTVKAFNWILFGGVIIAIIFFGIIVYVILGKWYEKRYESYLFKNKNDLYNVVTYIHSAKIRGVRDDEIERNLRRSKWSNEQVNYIMKKYVGKKIGLPGFTKKYAKKK